MPFIGELPEAARAYPLTQLLVLAQTDQTAEPSLGSAYANRAYELSTANTSDQAGQPTDTGNAAALVGLRGYQGTGNIRVANRWFDTSFNALPVTDSVTRRERIATHILQGRANGHYGILSDSAASFEQARRSFADGERLLWQGSPGDRYGTILLAHWAVLEAIAPASVKSDSNRQFTNSDEVCALPPASRSATLLALQAALKSVASSREDAPIGKHLHFAGKHVAMSLPAILLDISRPAHLLPGVRRARNTAAARILMPNYRGDS